MISTFEDIRVEETQARVRLIAIDRPAARNALRTQTLAEIAAALRSAADDHDVGAVVITGNERCFAAGADLKEMAGKGPIDLLTDPRPMHWRSIAGFSKPLIAAVDGFALGAGFELVLHADIVVADAQAQFGLPEIRLGIIPGAGGTQRLTRLAGKSRAMKAVLTGEPIDAQTALQWGVVSELISDGSTVRRAMELATMVASKGPLAVRAAKESVQLAEEAPLSVALDAERRAFMLLSASRDRQEGISAFLEKRDPVFTGH